MRIGGSGDITISNSYIETTGQGSDHADGIQAYAPGSTGNVTVTNTMIVSHSTAATAGMFIADGYSGTFTFDNVVFQGGPYGLRIAADTDDIYVSMKDVYFIDTKFLFEEVNANIHFTHWENVRSATIVNGELVPGPSLAPGRWKADGGGSGVTTIDHFSNDSGSSSSDGVTNDNTLTLTGSAAANSAVKVFDGATQIGTTTANSSGAWTYTTAALSDGSHSLKATATTTSGTSSTSSVLAVKIDTAAPTAPTMATPTNNANGGFELTGAAEANSVEGIRRHDPDRDRDGQQQWRVELHHRCPCGRFAQPHRKGDGCGRQHRRDLCRGHRQHRHLGAPGHTGSADDRVVLERHRGGGRWHHQRQYLQLKGTAAANSTVKIYDGATQIGTTTASSTGSWDYITSVLSNAKHVLTATATTSSGQTSAASGAVSVTVDKVAPTIPVLSSNSIVNTNQVKLSGTAEANSMVTVYDGATAVGTGTTNSSGPGASRQMPCRPALTR